MIRLYVLDAAHRPVALADPDPLVNTFAMALWMEAHPALRHVGDTKVGRTRVSTIFLGLDHNPLGIGAPVLFETRVFGGALDAFTVRYTSWDDAQLGHLATSTRVQTAHLLDRATAARARAAKRQRKAR